MYLGNVPESDVGVEPGVVEIDGDDVDTGPDPSPVGKVFDGVVVVPAGVVLVPHPATSPTIRMATASSPAIPDTWIFFIGMPPYSEFPKTKPPTS